MNILELIGLTIFTVGAIVVTLVAVASMFNNLGE